MTLPLLMTHFSWPLPFLSLKKLWPSLCFHPTSPLLISDKSLSETFLVMVHAKQNYEITFRSSRYFRLLCVNDAAVKRVNALAFHWRNKLVSITTVVFYVHRTQSFFPRNLFPRAVNMFPAFSTGDVNSPAITADQWHIFPGVCF